jgi:hypothetical protein
MDEQTHQPPAIAPTAASGVAPPAGSWFARAVPAIAATAALAVVGVIALRHLGHDRLRLFASIAAMGLIVAGHLADRRGMRRAGMAVTVVIAALAVVVVIAVQGHRAKALLVKRQTSAWNVFHYVLGTKYFDELGYFDFYNGVLIADAEIDGGRFAGVRQVRDMHTDQPIPRAVAIEQAQRDGVRARFSDERWESFKRDLAAIQRFRAATAWEPVLMDLGFNPSPGWLALHYPLTNVVNIRDRDVIRALCVLDLILYVLTAALIAWAFGARSAALAALWFVAFFGTEENLIGQYLHYDWLFLMVAATAFWAKGFGALAGGFLSYAAMMRGFPGLLAIPVGIEGLRHVLRLRLPPRKVTAFLVALAIGCAVWAGLGSRTARGAGAWLEWKEKIAIHAENHPLFAQRVGLLKLFTIDFDRPRWKVKMEKRPGILAENHRAYRAAQAALVALLLLAMVKRREHDAMLLALGVVFAGMILSRYYATAWILLLTWTATDRRRIGNLLLSLGLFAPVAGYFAYELEKTSAWKMYYLFNAWMAFYFLAAAVFFLACDVRQWRRGRVAALPASSPVAPAVSV